MFKRRRNKQVQEPEAPWSQYRSQSKLQEAVDPVRLRAERDRCRQLLDGVLSWSDLLGEK